MGIKRFFDQDIIVKRLRAGSGNKRSFQSTATVDGHVQSLNRETRVTLGILDERAWLAWFDLDADIKEGDVLTDEAGVDYSVREITKKNYGVNQHLEVLLMEKNV